MATLTIPSDVAARLEARAKARGLTIEQLVIEWASEDIAPLTAAQLQQHPKEWMRRLREWGDQHSRSTPLLSDDDLSRENLY